MTEPWKTWLVTLHIEWSHDGTLHDAAITTKVGATSAGHAISRLTTSVTRWNITVIDATADMTS